MTTLASPISTRPIRWWIATFAEAVLRGQLVREPRQHRLGHLLERLVLEIEDVAAARAAAHRADERRDGAGLVARRLGDRGPEVERLRAEAERPAGYGRDECDLVAVVQRRRPALRTRG